MASIPTSGSRWRGWRFDIHAPNEAAFNVIDVLHHSVGEDVALQVANELADIDNGVAGRKILDAQRLNVGIDDFPLALPVLADGRTPEHASAVHSVRPVHVGVHERENSIDIARVEGRVRRREQFRAGPHPGHPAAPAGTGRGTVESTAIASRMRRSPSSRPSGLYHSEGVWAPPPCPPAPMDKACNPSDSGIFASVEAQSMRARIPR